MRALLGSEPKAALDSPYPTGGTLLEAYIRILYGGALSDLTDTSPISFQAARRDVLSWSTNHHNDSGDSGGGGGSSSWSETGAKSFKSFTHSLEAFLPSVRNLLGRTPRPSFIELVGQMCTGRSFFRTTDGLIGIGPDASAPGDQVCTLFGSTRLLVLRPLPESNNRYHVIGNCFLQGAMHGEAVLGPLPGDVEHVFRSSQGRWFFENKATGSKSEEDPREKTLGLNLSDDSRSPGEGWLKIGLDVISPILAARGVSVTTFDLV